jgi:hypothetical protein
MGSVKKVAPGCCWLPSGCLQALAASGRQAGPECARARCDAAGGSWTCTMNSSCGSSFRLNATDHESPGVQSCPQKHLQLPLRTNHTSASTRLRARPLTIPVTPDHKPVRALVSSSSQQLLLRNGGLELVQTSSRHLDATLQPGVLHQYHQRAQVYVDLLSLAAQHQSIQSPSLRLTHLFFCLSCTLAS